MLTILPVPKENVATTKNDIRSENIIVWAIKQFWANLEKKSIYLKQSVDDDECPSMVVIRKKRKACPTNKNASNQVKKLMSRFSFCRNAIWHVITRATFYFFRIQWEYTRGQSCLILPKNSTGSFRCIIHEFRFFFSSVLLVWSLFAELEKWCRYDWRAIT